jgi:zinc resistance-associated protein
MKKLLIVSIILAIIGLGANGFAQMGMGHGKGMGMMQNGAYKTIPWFTALTPEKQTAVQKIMDNNTKDITALKLKMSEKKARLDTMLFEDGTSQKDIDKVVSEINAIRSKLYQKNINVSIALKKAGVPHPFYNRSMGDGGCGKKAGMGMMKKMKNCPTMPASK